MALDIVDLRVFYASPLGGVAQMLVTRAIQGRWPDMRGYSLLGLGYAPPYLELLRAGSERALAFMPATLGVMHWPGHGLSASALVEPTDMPLRDSSVDRLLLVHALEMSQYPGALLEEIWRVLTPGGRLIAIVPKRAGFWARSDSTPFGQGQPYSREQLTLLLREALFTPMHWGEALYLPPSRRKLVMRCAAAWERIAAALNLPFAGVHVIEAAKQIYRPALAKKPARAIHSVKPVLAPAGGLAAR